MHRTDSTGHFVACVGATGVQIKTPQTILTEEDVTPSVQRVDDRLAKTIKLDLDAPVLREICQPCNFGELFTEIRHGPAIERYRVIKSLKRQSEQHRFPLLVEGKKRQCFKHRWLQKHQWLVYSYSLDGGLCLLSIIFVKTEDRRPAKSHGIRMSRQRHGLRQLSRGPLSRVVVENCICKLCT